MPLHELLMQEILMQLERRPWHRGVASEATLAVRQAHWQALAPADALAASPGPLEDVAGTVIWPLPRRASEPPPPDAAS